MFLQLGMMSLVGFLGAKNYEKNKYLEAIKQDFKDFVLNNACEINADVVLTKPGGDKDFEFSNYGKIEKGKFVSNDKIQCGDGEYMMRKLNAVNYIFDVYKKDDKITIKDVSFFDTGVLHYRI